MRGYLRSILSCAAACFLAPSDGVADHDFKYKNVIACGPKVVTNIPPEYAGRHYYVIHDNEAGDHFSIVRKYAEFSSFKRMHYSELYVQRGGEKWLEFERLNDGTIRFELHDHQVKYRKYVTYITYSRDWLTADVVFDWKDEPLSLVCWNYKKSS